MTSRNFFKICPMDWLSENTQLLTEEETGSFLNLCILSFSNKGKINIENKGIISRKLKITPATLCDRIKSYCDLDLVVYQNDILSIKMLTNQFDEYDKICIKNKENAKLRWENKEKKCDRIPIEKNRVEKNRVEKNNNKKEEDTKNKKNKTFKTLTEEEFKIESYTIGNEMKLDKDLIKDFFEYWSEPSATGKMRFQLQATWKINLRLSKWTRNNFANNKNQENKALNDFLKNDEDKKVIQDIENYKEQDTLPF